MTHPSPARTGTDAAGGIPRPVRPPATSAPSGRAGGPHRRRTWTWSSAGTGAVFVLPTLTIFTAMVLAPILWTLYTGMTDERATRPDTSFVGLDNYGFLLGNEEFRHSLWNTVVITVIVVVLTNLLGLAIALLLRRPGGSTACSAASTSHR